MELPITVVFEPPSQAELRALLRRRRMWVAAAVLALAIGLVLVVAGVSRAESEATASSVPLTVASSPAGAAISIDGQHRGRSPARLEVTPGVHRVLLRTEGAIEAEYMVNVPATGGSLDALLWRREPLVRRLRPSLPGATLDAAQPLNDGRLALVTRAAASTELAAWRLDPYAGTIDLLYGGVPGSRLALTPDGERLAYVGRDVGPPPARATSLTARSGGVLARSVAWLAPEREAAHAASHGMWRAPTDDVLLDLSWSPSEDSILGVIASRVADGTRHTRLVKLPTDGSAAEPLLSLPSEVVPGAFAWSPDGRHVAFVAHAGALNALCLLDLDGGFRYLADLDASDAPPLPYLPVAWSADSRRLAFVAPRQQPVPTQGWLSGPPRRGLHVVDVDAPEPRLIADVDAEVPAWREDGRIVLIARQRDQGTLAIQVLEDSGQLSTLVRLPLRVGPRYAALWNTRTGQLLVVDGATASTEFWLISLALEQPA